MIRFIRSLFAWRLCDETGVWSYWENSVSGDRKAIRERAPVMSPLNWDWLNGADRWIVVDVDGVSKGKGCLRRVPVVPPCIGWLTHNNGLCACYDDYPHEREARREANRY